MGVATAAASMGAVVTHETVAGVVPSSLAMALMETVRIVAGKLVENIPTRQLTSRMSR
jgi:hypothetical protein